MSVYTKEQQTRTVTNKETGKTKVFKSTGIDAKGKHFFTSLDNAKQREFATGEKPSLKTGIPVGRTSKGELGVLKTEEKKTKPRMGAHPKDFSIKGGPGPRGKFLKRMNMGGVMKNRGGTFKGTF
jgi:hypothetical protein